MKKRDDFFFQLMIDGIRNFRIKMKKVWNASNETKIMKSAKDIVHEIQNKI